MRRRYQEFNKKKLIRKRVLFFNGPISTSHYLNIINVETSGDVMIKLILSGSTFAPDVNIEFTPALSQ